LHFAPVPAEAPQRSLSSPQVQVCELVLQVCGEPL
jgi:hypothetical protein